MNYGQTPKKYCWLLSFCYYVFQCLFVLFALFHFFFFVFVFQARKLGQVEIANNFCCFIAFWSIMNSQRINFFGAATVCWPFITICCCSIFVLANFYLLCDFSYFLAFVIKAVNTVYINILLCVIPLFIWYYILTRQLPTCQRKYLANLEFA